MSKPGPKKTPTKVLKLRGSWLAKCRQDVEVDLVVPVQPEGLDAAGKKFWDKTVPELTKMGILASVDWAKLEILCDMYSKLMFLKKGASSPIIKHTSEAGNVTYEDNKIYHAYVKMMDRFNKLASEFCIGPASRAGMGGIQEKKKKDAKAKFFKGA